MTMRTVAEIVHDVMLLVDDQAVYVEPLISSVRTDEANVD